MHTVYICKLKLNKCLIETRKFSNFIIVILYSGIEYEKKCIFLELKGENRRNFMKKDFMSIYKMRTYNQHAYAKFTPEIGCF